MATADQGLRIKPAELRGAPGASAAGRRMATAEVVAAFRAADRLRPPAERIFDDPYAEMFVTDRRLRRLLDHPWIVRLIVRWRELRTPGILGGALLRCRYADDVLREAGAAGVSQLVLLGAGFDSTALRRPVGDGMSTYELDLPEVHEAKRELLARRGIDDVPGVTRVPCDFSRETAGSALERTGFDRDAPALFNWLGVTMFLDRESVEATLRDVAATAAPGSRILFDYIDRSVPDGTTTDRGARRAARDVRRRGEPFRFGLDHDEVPSWITRLGFRLLRNETPDGVMRRCFPNGAPLQAPDYFGLVLAESG